MDTPRKTAFVIDDDTRINQLHSRILTMAGYTVTSFKTVDAAREALLSDGVRDDATLPSLILTDNDTKSRYTGLDLLADMKGARCGLVLASGDDLTTYCVKEAGGPHAEHLIKGKYDPNQLIAAAKRACENARLASLNLTQTQSGRGIA